MDRNNSNNIIGIVPLQYVHVLNLTTNITKLETGPQTIVIQTNERLAGGPFPFVIVPPGHFCVVKDPVSNYVHEKSCEQKFGEVSIRLHKEPFPLYPGERIEDAENFGTTESTYTKAIKPLPVIKANYGLKLKARRDHIIGGTKRNAGDIWQLKGPLTYYPTPEAKIIGISSPHIIKYGYALRLQATEDCIDKYGKARVTGEEWLVREEGAYLPGVSEKVVVEEKAYTLTPDKALHCRATQSLTDVRSIKRRPGDEWLVTKDQLDSYIPPIGVEVIQVISRTVLPKNSYCVVLDPVNKQGHNQLGKRELRQGITNFFLHPGEKLEAGIQKAYVLSEYEAIVLQATEAFTDSSTEDSPTRGPGDRWMINGPLQYIPPTQVKIICKRKAIPLNKNEGVYVRDEQTGAVRAVMGPRSFMLTAYEVLWEKKLPDIVETMLRSGGGTGSGDIRKLAYFEQSIDPAILKGRDKTRVVTYRCPGNTAVQVYNYKEKTARVIFGPDLVILGPHENFNVLSLSAGKPKKSDALKSLGLMLGPDFITDFLEVETSDHARLRVKLSFNNHFEVEQGNPESEAKIFSVSDFIGDACRQLGSRIRGSVARIAFDEFHRNSTQVIQHAVFGEDEDGKPKSSLKFAANNLVVSSVDIQSIEPVDIKMRDSLLKSVQMAIEIATSSIEASATHEAQRVEQIAKGTLDRQKLDNEKESEKERAKLLKLRAITAAVESTGQSTAEAHANAEKTLIECQSEIDAARLKAEAAEIEHNAELESQSMLRGSELAYKKAQNNLEVHKSKTMVDIEVKKFEKMISTLGKDTITAIANAGPETQVNLLKSLGIKSTLITDGNTPINLFNTASGLVGGLKDKAMRDDTSSVY
ncbi:unnamed protein product [Owenia fusiformis]|uniref:Major vault protein n=1 Tax=Owenia fusiformis TaxID=6347 RepID=A0A8J1T898_OWEFU|nr:unnamed protein product [Owenia fusiformis]